MADKGRSIDEIRADLAANRVTLGDAVGEGIESVKPKNIAKKGIQEVKTFAETEFGSAKAQFVDDEGGWRTDRLLMIGGAVLGVVAALVALNVVANKRAVTSRAKKEVGR